MCYYFLGRFPKQEAYAELAAKYFSGTRIARCNQLHKEDLVLDENCESTFDILFSEHKSKISNGARSFYEASLRHLTNNIAISYCNIGKSCISARYLNT